MSGPSPTLSLTLPSVHASLKQVVDATEGFLVEHVRDEDLAYKVLLLTTEAVTNAIEHGNALDPSKSFSLELHAGDEQLSILVEDEGSGFERKGVANPLREENLLDDGGRGLYLMETLADEVAYENEGRRVRLVFHLPPPAA